MLRAYAERVARHDRPSEEHVAPLQQNRFTFLNATEDNPIPMDWDLSRLPRLWRYHLHYFDYARTLALANTPEPDPADRRVFLGWVEDWIDHNPVGRGLAWDAFVTASRLMNWALAFAVFGHAHKGILESMARQTAYLRAHVEYDVRANHLLKNAAALAVAGRMLGPVCTEGRAALAQGLDLLERELAEQVLPDGGHYEGSLMYHCHVLEDCLMVCAVLRDPPPFLNDALTPMVRFLARALHADGEIPLFGDAALRTRMPARALIALAGELCEVPAPEPARGCYAFDHSGLYVMERDDRHARMIVKAGLPAPPYQLGHSHCDLLSYELTVRDRRCIVDSGVKGYEPDAWRQYCRSTGAHNTVRVNKREQLECWDAFRVGRRCRPQVHGWRADENVSLRASHDGFDPYRHERLVHFERRRFWVVVDTVTGPGVGRTESFIHFDPTFAVEEQEGLWRVCHEDHAIFIKTFGEDSVALVRGCKDPLQGWHCPEFGTAEPAHCLILSRQAVCPLTFGYAILVDPCDLPSRRDLEELVGRLRP